MSQLILTLDDDLVQEAQEYALRHGQGLDALVADFLRTTVRPVASESKTPRQREQRLAIVRELAGSVSLPADFDYEKALEEGLREKYGL